MVNYKHKLDVINSEVKEAENILKAKKKTRKMIVDMVEKQEAAEQDFSLINLESDPVYNKAVSQGNYGLINKLKNRSMTPEEYELELKYDTVRDATLSWCYKYVTKQWKVWLVNWKNEEVIEPIYDQIYIDVRENVGLNEKWPTSTRWITLAIKWDEMFYLDSFNGFQQIDTTWYKGTGWGRQYWYTLYKVEWEKTKEEIEKDSHSWKNKYILGRRTDTNEITITKREK